MKLEWTWFCPEGVRCHWWADIQLWHDKKTDWLTGYLESPAERRGGGGGGGGPGSVITARGRFVGSLSVCFPAACRAHGLFHISAWIRRTGALMCSGYRQPHGNVQHKIATLSVCQLLAYVTCDRGYKGVSFISLSASCAVGEQLICEILLLFKPDKIRVVSFDVCVFCLFSCLCLVCDYWQWLFSGQIFICLLGGGIFSNPRACSCGLYPSPPVCALYCLIRNVFVCWRTCMGNQ